MVKITILGSCRFEPYEILAVPEKNELWNTEEGYQLAFKKFKKAIDESDLIILYNPDGTGEHTGRDADYAYSKKKYVVPTHHGFVLCEHCGKHTHYHSSEGTVK